MLAGEKAMTARQSGLLVGLSKKPSWSLCHGIRQSFRARSTAAFTDGKSFVLRLEPKLRSDFESLVGKYTSPIGELTDVAAAASENGIKSRRIAGGSSRMASTLKINPGVVELPMRWLATPDR